MPIQPKPIAIWNSARDAWEVPETRGLLCEHSTVFSETFAVSGMTRNGAAYALPTWAHRTAGSGFSSSPDDEAEDGLLGTPTSRMWKGAGPQGGPTQIRNKARGLIEAQVMDLLPTTRAQHGEDRNQRIWARPLDQPQNLENALALLPTPLTSDGTGGTGPADVAKDFSTPLRAIAALLPTPSANVGTNGGSQHPDKRRAGNHQPSIQDVAEHVLLPTPQAHDHVDGKTAEQVEAMRKRTGAGVRNLNETAANELALLQTPSVADGMGGHLTRSGDRSNEKLLPGQAKELATDWGLYAPAIHRWERALGRPAPSPTEPNAKGNPRLSPKFTEWMMGVPEGWITDIPISRNEQLKAAGNGVVRQQAAAALADMLAAFGEAP